MFQTSLKTFEDDGELLMRRFGDRLRVISKQTVKNWFVQHRLDRLLASYISSLEGCRLLYAIDRGGRQVSSNIRPDAIDDTAFGQDLSERPYVRSLFVPNDNSFDRVFAYDSYPDRKTQRSCVTIMHGVTSGTSLMGFVAADFCPWSD